MARTKWHYVLHILATFAGFVHCALDTATLSKTYFGNDSPWYTSRIPFFECSDSNIQDTYYYRWGLFRAHQRDLGERGFASTEFLDDVPWAVSPWNVIVDATGLHVAEGQWLRDHRFIDDYVNLMYSGGNTHGYSEWLSSSIFQRYLVNGDSNFLTSHLQDMVDNYNNWSNRFDSNKGLYYQEPIADGTEYTIGSIDASGGQDGFFGGWAYRPALNAYQWASANAIAATAKMVGRSDIVSDFANRASELKQHFQRDIWNPNLQHFVDRYQQSTNYVNYYDFIRGRELVGYVPWQFSMPDDNATFSAAWQHLSDHNKFYGPNGMRTNEPGYQYYMRQYRYDAASGGRECQWNGPVWPYQTSQVLTAMANLLNNYKANKYISKANFLDELRRYTHLHSQAGHLDLQEDFEPDKEGIIVGLSRSHHYFHSSYLDIIIQGLVGLRPQQDDSIQVNPLIPDGSAISFFRLQDVLYHGRNISVQWDYDGSRYKSGAGLRIEIDGTTVAKSSGLGKLTAKVARGSMPKVLDQRKPQSVQLQNNDDYPKGSASSGADSTRVHQAIDGRTWFYPELPNGWDSDVSTTDSAQWYTIDFGKSLSLSGASLAFFTDGSQYQLPRSDFQFQILQSNGSWTNIKRNGGALVANGVAEFTWQAVPTQKLRFAFTQPAYTSARIVEFKAYT